jgi:hypothetical protein
LRARYLETTELAITYTRYLDTLNAVRRVEEIRLFRSLDYNSKKELVLALPSAKLDRSCDFNLRNGNAVAK